MENLWWFPTRKKISPSEVECEELLAGRGLHTVHTGRLAGGMFFSGDTSAAALSAVIDIFLSHIHRCC